MFSNWGNININMNYRNKILWVFLLPLAKMGYNHTVCLKTSHNITFVYWPFQMWTTGSVTFILGLLYFQICMHTRTSKSPFWPWAITHIFKRLPFIVCVVSTTVMLLTKEDLQRILAPAGYIGTYWSEEQVQEEYKVLFFFPQKKVINCFQTS